MPSAGDIVSGIGTAVGGIISIWMPPAGVAVATGAKLVGDEINKGERRSTVRVSRVPTGSNGDPDESRGSSRSPLDTDTAIVEEPRDSVVEESRAQSAQTSGRRVTVLPPSMTPQDEQYEPAPDSDGTATDPAAMAVSVQTALFPFLRL